MLSLEYSLSVSEGSRPGNVVILCGYVYFIKELFSWDSGVSDFRLERINLSVYSKPDISQTRLAYLLIGVLGQPPRGRYRPW